jgi:hypothetical protein
MKRKVIIIIGLAAFIVVTSISGCTSSSDVVPMGQNTYMIARTQWGFTGPAPIKAAALKEADDYCRKRGKVMKVIKTVEIGLKFGSEPAAEVYFKCLDPDDPELKKDTTIEEITR